MLLEELAKHSLEISCSTRSTRILTQSTKTHSWPHSYENLALQLKVEDTPQVQAPATENVPQSKQSAAHHPG